MVDNLQQPTTDADVTAAIVISGKTSDGDTISQTFTMAGNTDGSVNRLAKHLTQELAAKADQWASRFTYRTPTKDLGGSFACMFSVSGPGGGERTFHGDATASDGVYLACSGVIESLKDDVLEYLKALEPKPEPGAWAEPRPVYALEPPRRGWLARLFG